MRTLIVPCAGRSTRYPDMRPKWLLTHPNGELMLKKALSAVDMSLFDRVYIVIVKEHDKRYDAGLILRQVFPSPKIKVHVLKDFTSCVAETIHKVIKDNRIKGEIVIKDSDNFVGADYSARGNFVIGMNIEHREVSRLAAKSFIKVNEAGLITDIIEKRVKSNLVSLGVYGFESAELFERAYASLSGDKAAELVGGELYISHVIAYCIGSSLASFSYYEAGSFEDWGTLGDWLKVQRRHATYLVDVDGVVMKNCGRYGRVNWSNNEEMLPENVKALKALAAGGAQLVFITSRAEAYRRKLEKLFARHGITYHAMVMGCNHSPRVVINDFAPSNPYPSCEAVNIPRNARLSDYLGKAAD